MCRDNSFQFSYINLNDGRRKRYCTVWSGERVTAWQDNAGENIIIGANMHSIVDCFSSTISCSVFARWCSGLHRLYIRGRSCKKVSCRLSSTWVFSSVSMTAFTTASVDTLAIRSCGHHSLPTPTLVLVLWGFLEDYLCRNPLPLCNITNELKNEISSVFISLSSDALAE
jgi:hypothetical protein